MNSWSIVAIVAIAIWGVVQVIKAKHGIVSDNRGNETLTTSNGNDDETQREVIELRERVKVLERIATDANTTESLKIKQISDEIDSLRDK